MKSGAISKKALAVFLGLAVLLSCLIIPGMTVSAAEVSGSGTETDPYMVTDADQLLEAVTDTTIGVYYKLANDIVINDIVVKIEEGVGVVYDATGTTALTDDQKAALRGWNTKMSAFAGTLDGDGHIVRGLYVNDGISSPDGGADYNNGRGLINKVADGAAIRNLGLEDTYVSFTNGTAAGFVANAASSDVSFENCYVDASAYFYGYNVGIFMGSGTRSGAVATLKNCYSQGSFTTDASGRGGAITGDIWSAPTGGFVFENLYVTTPWFYGDLSQRIVGYNYYEKVTDSKYFGSAIDGSELYLEASFVATEELPTLAIFTEGASSSWNGMPEKYSGGSGKTDDPYKISTPGALAHAVSTFGNNEYFVLTNDIYLNDIEKIDWSTGLVKDGYNVAPNSWFVGNTKSASTYLVDGTADKFEGTFDGNGYAVHGLWYSPDMTDTASGLIPAVNGTVKNLTISNSYVVGGVYTGAVSSYLAGTLATSYVDDTVTVVGKKNMEAASYSLGGLVGWSAGITVTDCGFSGTLENQGTGHVYGFIGTSWNTRITATGGYSLGYQPFTTSSSALNATSAEEAETTFKNRYVVTDVYTDTHFKNNNASYKLDADGDGSYTDETSVTISTVIVFVELDADRMTGKTALDNMTALSGDTWYATNAAPLLRIWGTAHGDVDEDGAAPTANDLLEHRKTLIGASSYINTDYLRDGVTDVCDLVALAILRADIDGTNCKHSYSSEVIVKSTATTNGTADLTCAICGDTYTETLPTEVKILAIGNSFSVDGMQYLWNILTDAGVEKVTLGNLSIGGCTLATHWTNISENNSAYSYAKNTSGSWSTSTTTLSYGLADEDWDFITIQQASHHSGMPSTYDDLPNILDYLNENKTNSDAKIFWHMTWAYQQDSTHSGFNNYDKDQTTMYNAILQTVRDEVLTEELISGVIPSGTTIQNMRTSYLGDTLTRDGYHMSYDYGRYAVGLTWMTAITGISADKVDWVPTSYTYVADHNDMIDESVANAIANPYEVTNSSYTVAPES